MQCKQCNDTGFYSKAGFYSVKTVVCDCEVGSKFTKCYGCDTPMELVNKNSFFFKANSPSCPDCHKDRMRYKF